MAKTKTYYLGRTKGGAIVGRGSMTDYGYTHAAVRNPDKYAEGVLVPTSGASFSRSAEGARSGAARYRPDIEAEVVAVEVVDAATFKAATGKR